MSWYATIAPDSPRRATWIKVFGSSCVPVMSGTPVNGNYELDYQALSAKAQKAVLKRCASKWLLPIDMAKSRIMARGVPIADGTDIAVTPGEGVLF